MVWYWHGDLTRVEKMYEYFRASAVGYFLSDQAKYCFRLCQILSINYQKWTHSFLYLNIPPSLNGEEVAVMPIQKRKKKKTDFDIKPNFWVPQKTQFCFAVLKKKMIIMPGDHSSITLSRFFAFLGQLTNLFDDLQYCKSSKIAIFWPQPLFDGVILEWSLP